MTGKSKDLSSTSEVPASKQRLRGFTMPAINAEGVTQAGISSTVIMGATEAIFPLVGPLGASPRLIALVLCALAACMCDYEGAWRRRAASYVFVVAFLFTGAFGANRAAHEIKSEIRPAAYAAESAQPQQRPTPRRPFDPW